MSAKKQNTSGKKEKTAAPKTNEKAKQGDTVRVHYTGTLDNGMMFDTSEGKDPLEFVLGEKMVIKGFDDAVSGMAIGEEKTVRIIAKDAYGERINELVQEIPVEGLKDKDKFQPGMVLTLKDPEGRVVNAFVVSIDDKKMVLDLNHPLADQNLTFKIKLVSIK